MLPKKHLSGAAKRKKRKLEDQFAQSQKGAIHKFFSSQSSVVPDGNPNEVEEPSIEEHEQQQVNNLNEEDDATEPENLQ
jgi:hypothetical protein